MREPGTSFEFRGVTLHVVEQVDGCMGCIASTQPAGEWKQYCEALKKLGGGTIRYRSCGDHGSGVVYVRDVEQFKASIVAYKLTGGAT